MDENFDMLRLENQLCFPLYACAKELVRRYKPFLDPLGLTYTQYITMMLLWEHKSMSVKALGDCLYLDSGTLTPLLKRLEAKGYITRERSAADERSVFISISGAGEQLKLAAAEIPFKLGACVKLEPEEAIELRRLLAKLLGGMAE